MRLKPALRSTYAQFSGTPISAHSLMVLCGIFFSGFICGKNNTSWMKVLPVINMTKRSIPIPIPDVGGIPYWRERRKS